VPESVFVEGRLRWRVGFARLGGTQLPGTNHVAQAPGERRISTLEVSVEPRDAERIMRKVEEPDQFIVNRAVAPVHDNLV